MKFTLYIGLLFILTSCAKGKYTEIYEAAKQSNIQSDSLFLGFEFGISQDSFFNRCQVINESAGLYDSASKLRVGRKIDLDGTSYLMNFYPIFVEEKLAVMPFEIHHESYSQWNKQFYAEQILTKIKAYFTKEFNLKFEEFKHPEIGFAYIAFTGNRRLRIYVKDQKLVGGEFMDMSDKFSSE